MYRHKGSKTSAGLPGGRKSFDRFSRFNTIAMCDGQPSSHLSVAGTTLASVARVKIDCDEGETVMKRF